MKKQLNNIADVIIATLKTNGFSIHRYDAYSTNSIYLKLDYGVCNSIRISDHEGKQHLKYRYNVIIDGKEESVLDKYPRYYYNQNSLDKLLFRIILDRQQKVSKYGTVAYNNFMRQNNQESHDKKGFWAQAKLI